MRGPAPYMTRGQPLSMPNGTLDNPSVRFTRERSGMYRVGDGRLGFSVKKWRALEITQADAIIRSNSVSATVVPLTINRATAAATDGHENALDFMDGTTPVGRLASYRQSATRHGWRLYTYDAGLLATPAMFIDGTGNVGLGGSTAGYKLTINQVSQADTTGIGLIRGAHVGRIFMRDDGSLRLETPNTSIELQGGGVSALIPTTDLGMALGASNRRFVSFFSKFVQVDQEDSAGSYAYELVGQSRTSWWYHQSGGHIFVGGSTFGAIVFPNNENVVRPNVASTHDLGTSSFRWNTVYAVGLNIAGGSVTLPNASVQPTALSTQRCIVRHSTSFTVGNGVQAWHPMDTEVADTNGWHNPLSNSERITVTEAGYYRAFAFCHTDPGSGQIRADLVLNGTPVSGDGSADAHGYHRFYNGHWEGSLSAGDWFAIQVSNASGGTITIGSLYFSRLSVTRVS